MSLFAYPYEMAAHLIVSGEDAADFLQSQFSNDLRPYSVGQCTYGLWLDVRGKIVADSWILCEGGERFRIFSENCAGDAIKEKLESHIIADDVELEPGGPVPGLALVGNDSDAAAGKSDGVWLDFPGRRSLLPSREILFDDGSFRGSWLEAKACQIVSKKWIQNERMKCGIPAVGGEALPGDLPGEVGLVGDAVSLKKGCFLGQEVVARMFNVGRPQRGLYVLSGRGRVPELPCAVANDQGKALGELRTATETASGWHGVAMLKSRFVEGGLTLELDGREATVEKAFMGKMQEDDGA